MSPTPRSVDFGLVKAQEKGVFAYVVKKDWHEPIGLVHVVVLERFSRRAQRELNFPAETSLSQVTQCDNGDYRRAE